jgi:O-glycosyl hydrolase
VSKALAATSTPTDTASQSPTPTATTTPLEARVEAGKKQAEVAEQTIRQMSSMTLESVQAFEQIIGAANQQQIIKAVGASLAAKGLIETAVSASDENSLDDAYNILRAYDATSLGYVAQMNAHSYSGTARANLRTLATSSGKRLWQSESGPLNVSVPDETDSALFMAGRIMTDLRDLQPDAWIDWQVADTSGQWATISLNDAQQSFRPLKRFYMHAGFSRFIRPGATMLAVSGPDMVAALAPDGSTLAIVVRNGDTAAGKSFTFDLTAIPMVGTEVAVYRTSRTENLAAQPPIAVQGWSFTLSAAPYSVTTLVIALTP